MDCASIANIILLVASLIILSVLAWALLVLFTLLLLLTLTALLLAILINLSLSVYVIIALLLVLLPIMTPPLVPAVGVPTPPILIIDPGTMTAVTIRMDGWSSGREQPHQILNLAHTTTQQVTHAGSPGTATAYCGYNCLSMRRPSATGAKHLYTAKSSGLDRYTISATYTTSGFCRSAVDNSHRGYWDYDNYVAVCCYRSPSNYSATCPRGWGRTIWNFWGLDSSSDRAVGSHAVSTCDRVRGYYDEIPGPFAILGSYFANAVASSTSTVTTTHYRT